MRHRPSAHFLTRRLLLISSGAALTSVALTNLRNGLDAAEVSAPTPTEDRVRVLKAGVAKIPLRGSDAAPTSVWCYGGSVPGPVLRVRQGEELRLRLVTELPEQGGVHWHGVRGDNAADRATPVWGPATTPGGSFDYRLRVPDAGTFWYHGRRNGPALSQGLYGALIVEESVPVEADRDVLLVLDEWRLEGDGAIAAEGAPDQAPAGRVTANGRPVPDIAVKANERVRLRVINAAVDRRFLLRIDRHRTIVMAIDGEPTEPFEARNGQVALGPGNRLDLFVDATLAAGDSAAIVALQPAGEAPLARLVYAPGPPVRLVRRPEPQSLPPNPLPLRMSFEQALRQEIALQDQPAVPQSGPWTVAAPAPAPLFSVRQGRTVMLTLINRGGTAHAVHVHGHHFRLLDNLDDGWKPFWLDTLTVPGRQTVRLAFVADNPGVWPIEQRLLMPWRPTLATWFEVTAGPR